MSRFFLSALVVLTAVLSLAAAQSITFSQVASTSAFPPREYPACTQTQATVSNPTPTLFFFGGLNVTLTGTSSNIATTGNSYTDGYFNDAWSSTNLGATWSQLTGAAGWAPQGWNGAVTLSNGNIVFIGGGADSNSGQNNQVWTTTTTSAGTFTQSTQGPWAPRENFGFTGTPGTQNVLIALGNTNNAESVDDIWFSTNGGGSWTQTCHYTSCPFVSSVDSTRIAGQVHGPAAAGFSNGVFLLMGGYGNDPSSTSNTTWVTNQVAVSSNGFSTWQTYTAPWSPRAQQRAVVDADNFVYVYGGVIDIPTSGSSTATYPSVASQAYYGYFQDLWYSTNAATAGTGASWTQISVSGISSAGYPNLPYSNNPNSGVIPSSFYSSGAIFNPCLGFGYSSSGAKQLVLYTGLYAGYRQNQQAGLAVAYPGVYVGTLSSGSNGAAATSAASVVLAAVLACVMALVL